MTATASLLQRSACLQKKVAAAPIYQRAASLVQRQNPSGPLSGFHLGLKKQSRGSLHISCATGGSVLDRPATSTPGVDKGKDTQKKKPRFYRVMLHNDNTNKREYVVQVLLKVVKVITVDDAVNVMQEAHVNGLACVIACAQEEAEQYCEGLRNNGLIASIEPTGNGGGDGTA